jgi:cytokinin dehydrogenase
MTFVEQLSERLSGPVSDHPAALEAAAWDFGAMVRRAPTVVVEPLDAGDVCSVLDVASHAGVPVAVRGTGHSQSGQCLVDGGICMDMRRIDSVRVDAGAAIVEAGAGATWRSIIDAAFALGFLPRALTLVVDATIGGTLSMAGVGALSFRAGAQVNNVRYLDVVTPGGELLRCSSNENRELFDCVRSGLGQCGVIVKAGYSLRPCRKLLRSYSFMYRDAETFVRDVERLYREPRTDFLLGSISATQHEAPGYAIVLSLGKEYDSEQSPDDADVRAGLRFAEELPKRDTPLWDETGVPGHIFFRQYTGRPWNESGGVPATAHPWVDHLFTPDDAVQVLADVLARPPMPLRMGTCAIIPVARTGEPAPLFALPPSGDVLFGLGMFPEVPRSLSAEVGMIMALHSVRCRKAGGKRYLSGYVEFETAAEWADHYGEAYAWFSSLKSKYDPRGLLNPGFLRWA